MVFVKTVCLWNNAFSNILLQILSYFQETDIALFSINHIILRFRNVWFAFIDENLFL